MKFREITLKSGTKVLVGKNAEQNEELVKKFIGKENIILHTSAPGSPFCVIDNLKPNKKDIKESAVICAGYSQDWRDNKKDVIIHNFKGKNIYKEKNMKVGTFGIKKPKKIKAKKVDIEKFKE
ncbi:DUF814 domain-containing protein [Candidatus Pacearchaeota archaeon]|nr:DUF814 domain-containing protein [Candidatus Pacearchaeota archaeon]